MLVENPRLSQVVVADLPTRPLPPPHLFLHQRFQDALTLLAVIFIVELQTVAEKEVRRVIVVLLNPLELLCREVIICNMRCRVFLQLASEVFGVGPRICYGFRLI